MHAYRVFLSGELTRNNVGLCLRVNNIHVYSLCMYVLQSAANIMRRRHQLLPVLPSYCSATLVDLSGESRRVIMQQPETTSSEDHWPPLII